MGRVVMAVVASSLVAALAACRAQAPTTPPAPPAAGPVDKEVAALQQKTARFAPTDLSADIKALPPNERDALAHMIRAAQVMDALFLEQVWAGNETLFESLVRDDSPIGKARLHAFLINKGPWSRLDHNEPFVPGVPPKPPSANYYPADATKAEVEKWISSLSGADRARATGFFSTIRRDAAGRLAAVPYNLEYQGELALAAQHLRAAAAATAQPTLKAYLESRAAAFLSNDYYESDVKWMELDATIEPTIGPYEVYEDEWFNYKAAFEAFITVKDQAESAKLQKFAGVLQDIENNLPIDPQYRNPRLGAMAPIAVVNTVFSAGDGNRGVQTAAFNLPNDERVIKEKGSKRVMLKNNQQAKFDKVLTPISKVALAASDQGNISFDAFFTHILMHELMHGLGPHNITVNGRATTVRQELKDTYSTIEEAKADISGLFALQYLIDKHTQETGRELDRLAADALARDLALDKLAQLDKTMERTMYKTFLASAFRSIRFGINEAHGRGIAIQLNYLLTAGGFVVNADGTFSVNDAEIRHGVGLLTRQLMTLQAAGNYQKAKDMITQFGIVRPQVQKVLDKLKDVPVDIEPRFVTAEQLSKTP